MPSVAAPLHESPSHCWPEGHRFPLTFLAHHGEACKASTLFALHSAQLPRRQLPSLS